MTKSKALEYGLCGCGNPIEGTVVDLEFVGIKSVPKGICPSCRSYYFKADILETIEALLRGRERRCKGGPSDPSSTV